MNNPNIRLLDTDQLCSLILAEMRGLLARRLQEGRSNLAKRIAQY